MSSDDATLPQLGNLFNPPASLKRKISAPTIHQIVQKHLNLPKDQALSVHNTFITPSSEEYVIKNGICGPDLFRIFTTATLTTDVPNCSFAAPSGFSTLRWLLQPTTIPKTLCITSDDVADNEVGYGWAIVKESRDESLSRAWRKMPLKAKENLVLQFAQGYAQLLQQRNRFNGIGRIRSSAEIARLQELLPLESSRLTAETPQMPCQLSNETPRFPHWWHDSTGKLTL